MGKLLTKPADFGEERKLWNKGFGCVAGVDEVGRGAWAGPVAAAAVVFEPIRSSVRGPAAGFPPRTPARGPLLGGPPSRVTLQLENYLRHPSDIEMVGINDSKQLIPGKREKLAEYIKENALAWGVGEVPVSIINRFGIAKATKMAFRTAIADANSKLKSQTSAIDFLLIDAFYIPYVRGLSRRRQKPIVHGDQLSLSIAAASIIAKVYRDKVMKQLAKKHPHYRWAKNKGYGTREHQRAIVKYGITRLHRKKFVATWQSNLNYSAINFLNTS